MEKPFFAFWSLQLKNKLEHINLVYILRQLKNPLINTQLPYPKIQGYDVYTKRLYKNWYNCKCLEAFL